MIPHEARLCRPTLDTCVAWTGEPARRCSDPAAALLLAPDGEAAPGAYYCPEHAESVVAQLAAPGEAWTVRPLHVYTAACPRIIALEEALRDLLAFGVVLDDPRLGYLEVQMDRVSVDQARAVLSEIRTTPPTPAGVPQPTPN